MQNGLSCQDTALIQDFKKYQAARKVAVLCCLLGVALTNLSDCFCTRLWQIVSGVLHRRPWDPVGEPIEAPKSMAELGKLVLDLNPL